MSLRAALAGVVALLVMLGVACLAPPPSPTPEAPFVPEDRPPPASVGTRTTGRPEWVRVSGAGAGTVNLRAEPSTAGARLRGLAEGAELEVVGPDRAADGRTWRNVRDPSDGTQGWVAGDFLAPVAAPSVPSPSPRPPQ